MGGILFHPFVFAIVFATLLFFTQYEFYAMVEEAGHKIYRLPGTLLGLLFFFVCFGLSNGFLPRPFEFVFIPIFLTLFIIELFRSNKLTLQNSGITLLGFIYIATTVWTDELHRSHIGLWAEHYILPMESCWSIFYTLGKRFVCLPYRFGSWQT